MPPKEQWRYKNIEKEKWPNDIERCMKILEGDIDKCESQDWDGYFKVVFGDQTHIDHFYAYGLPMKIVCRAIKLMIQIQLNAFYHRMANPIKIPIKKHSSIFAIYFYFAILIDDAQYKSKVLKFIHDLSEYDDGDTNKEYAIYYRFIKNLTNKEFDSELSDMAEIVKKCEDGDRYEMEYYMAKRDVEGFNNCLEAWIKKMNGSESVRKRKRNVMPSDVCDLTITATIAFALDCGIPLTFKDSALPIWDFPIAQRPEIQKLLPDEVRELIPQKE